MQKVETVQRHINHPKAYEWFLSGWPGWATPHSPSGPVDETGHRVDWESIPTAPNLRRGRSWPLRETLFMLTPRTLPSLRRVTEWHVRSQQVSRRNALIASTSLAARRRELIEVDEFLDNQRSARGVKVGPRSA